MSELPLRERAKLRRRTAILTTAMRLFAERGFDATTIADIAEAAEVAPRSVSMYFPSKLDIALASTSASHARLLEALRSREPGVQFLEVFIAWLQNEPAAVGDQEWALRAAMLAANPTLGAGSATLNDDLIRETSLALAEELHLAADHVIVRIVLGLFAGVLLQYHLLPSAAEATAGCEPARAALLGALAGVRGLPPVA